MCWALRFGSRFLCLQVLRQWAGDLKALFLLGQMGLSCTYLMLCDANDKCWLSLIWTCLQCGRPRFNPWFGEIPLKMGMFNHTIIFAWRIPWTEEPEGLHIVHGVTRSWTWLSDFDLLALWGLFFFVMICCLLIFVHLNLEFPRYLNMFGLNATQKYSDWVSYKWQKFISHSFGGCEVLYHGSDEFSVWWELASWFIDGYLIAISSHSRRGKRVSWGFFYKGTIHVLKVSIFMTSSPSKVPPP